MAGVKIGSVLGKIYYNTGSPGGFAGVQRLYDVAKAHLPDLTISDVKKWLLSQEAYGIHFPFRQSYPRSRVISAGIDYLWEMDLMDMQKVAVHNDGYKYVLLVIDVFSRYIWTAPVRFKTGVNVVSILSGIVHKTHRRPKYLRSDRGVEFVNRSMKQWCQKNGVTPIFTASEVKAALAERAIKTVKGRLYRYMNTFDKERYINVLPLVTKAYNNTVHSSTGMAPIEVSKANEKKLWWYMYVSMVKHKPVRAGMRNVLQEGSYVRISLLRRPFDREYRVKWSKEVFQIYQRYVRDGIPVYLLRDINGEKLIGSFYREEIQPVHQETNKLYSVEKILESVPRAGGRLLHNVKWTNWNDSYNSWIRDEDLYGIEIEHPQ